MFHDLIVIGGGPAGMRAAHRARQLAARVALVERDKLGGTAVNDGVAPTRTLARAARYLRDARMHFADYGIVCRELRLDFAALQRKVQAVVTELHQNHQYEAALRHAGVDVYTQTGDARFIEPHQIELSDGRTLEGERFVLCVGGHARALQFPGSELTLNHHDLWSLESLPKSLVVVGGAATGCQVASICAQFGVQVTLLEMSPRLVAVEDELVSQVVQRIFEERGIDVVTGLDGLERIEKHGEELHLFYRHEGQVKQIDTHAVFVAAGWPGNADPLNLESAGVTVERSYVKVNEYLQSTAPHIYAAGDINGRLMLTQCAKIQADIATENALLGNNREYAPILVSHGSFTHPEYAGVGLTEAQARQKHDPVVAVVPYRDLDRAIIDSHTEGFFKLIADRQSHLILGAHVVGEQATDVAQEAAAAMLSETRVDELSHLELAYPTYTTIVSLAAARLSNELGLEAHAPAERAGNALSLKEEESYASSTL
ncbi:MAG: dihydrolipoyl dehydrogenase [Phycisphaerae bacterium]